ncbi:MAG: ATPase, T2SS/T4P/T4SS family [Acidithiobacillus sp.]
MIPSSWTDLFLLENRLERSFFQDAVSGRIQRVSQEDMPVLRDLLCALIQQVTAEGRSRSRGTILGNVPVRIEGRMTVDGWVFVCRRFPTNPFTLQDLRLPPALEAALFHPQRLPHRLLLITGRTGSGKSTFAAAFVREWLSRFGGTGWTIENPVENALQEIDYGEKAACFQVEVDHDDDFGAAIRDTLRSLPRLIMVGELRNGESADHSPGARAALLAASTGHLVVTTMHANDPISALQRLVSLCGGEQFQSQVADALGALLHLRLVVDLGSGKRRFDIQPLILPNGENGDDVGSGIRQSIREGNVHLLASELERQKLRFCGPSF